MQSWVNTFWRLDYDLQILVEKPLDLILLFGCICWWRIPLALHSPERDWPRKSDRHSQFLMHYEVMHYVAMHIITVSTNMHCSYNSRDNSWEKTHFKSDCSLRKLVNTSPMLNWAYESFPPLIWMVNCFCPSHCQVLALATISCVSWGSQIHCLYPVCYWEKADSWRLGGDCLDTYEDILDTFLLHYAYQKCTQCPNNKDR